MNRTSECSKNRVNGFLHTKGRDIVNGKGEKIILTGWGLGSWLLIEGYMWLADGGRFDRPRRIEAVIRELTGSVYARQFWKKYYDYYITREDIEYMANLGYNSVRIPINWRLLMADEPGIVWNEEGFKLIDRCIDWCENLGIYAFLDLHGAPGGQTGSNIDDSIDDFPRLFTDQESWDKCIALWKEIALRYRDRWIVGGYDLLNEPLRPKLTDDKKADYLLPKLVQFYDEVIKEIREIDDKHLLSIEGSHWATDTSIFFKKYDDNMVIHFHRYACMPGIESLKKYIDLSKQLNIPLWMGETGENSVDWYAAYYPLAVMHDIGYNLWTWKKMRCINSPCSVNKPEGWDEIIDYTNGGKRPSYLEAQKIFDCLLENIKLESCVKNEAVTRAIFRQPGCCVRGTDFDLIPGKGISYSGIRNEGNIYKYHTNTGMHIKSISNEPQEKAFPFDSGWDNLTLYMEASEFASYSIYNLEQNCFLSLELSHAKDSGITIFQDDKELCNIEFCSERKNDKTSQIKLNLAEKSIIKVLVTRGNIELNKLLFIRKTSI